MKLAARTALAATAALILSATVALAQPAPPDCQRLHLSDAECRNLAAEQAKDRAAKARPRPDRNDPALGKRERGTLKSGDTKVEYRALGN